MMKCNCTPWEGAHAHTCVSGKGSPFSTLRLYEVRARAQTLADGFRILFGYNRVDWPAWFEIRHPNFDAYFWT